MRLTLLTLIVGLLGLAGPAWSQQERTLLLIPFEMKGTYQPIPQSEISSLLKQYIEQTAPHVKVQIASSGAYMLDAKQAASLGQQAGTDLVLFGDVRFRHEAKAASLSGGPPEGYPGGSGVPQGGSMRYLVTVAGVAHGSLVESASANLVVDQEPQLLFESEMTGGAKDGPLMLEVEKRLADNCVRELSKGLVERIEALAKKATGQN